MGAPIERLFATTARDSRSTLWGPRRLITSNTLNAASVSTFSTVIQPPEGYVWEIRGVQISFRPDAVQQVLRGILSVTNESGNVIGRMRREEFFGAAGREANINIHDASEMLVWPMHRLVATGIFDAGVQPNTVEMAVSGIVYVRGNIALF